MVIEHPIEDDVTQLARRVSKARGRLAYQFDPALTEALSEDELQAERELAERIRVQDRSQRWKQAEAAAAASDRARQTTEHIEKADIRDLLLARKAIAAQRRESSPHAKLAALYRHRSWSLRALAGVVVAGMLWSAVNVQHNIAPGGTGDPLYWFSYLLEGMISVCLIIIMTGTNKVAEWGVVDNRKQVASAEIALLALTVVLNTYPYLRTGRWYDAAVHAVAPVMIGVALLIHDAASMRYGLAISRATEQVRDLPDPAEQIRLTLPALSNYRLGAPADMANWDPAPQQPANADSPPPANGADAAATPDADAIADAHKDTAASVNGSVRQDGGPAPTVGTENRSAPSNVEGKPVGAANSGQPSTPTAALDQPATTTDVDNAAWAEFDTLTASAGGGGVESDAAKGAAGGGESSDSDADYLDSYAAKVDKALQSVYVTDSQDTGQFRMSETLDQELADIQAERRRARTTKQR